jgi:DNA uptake protein ComE-like DNA-binding protein
MTILYRENVAYEVPDGLVALRLTQGFTGGLIRQPSAAIAHTEGRINVNTCTAAELVALQGIGVKTANEIIDGRPYESLDWFLSDPRTVPHADKFVL